MRLDIKISVNGKTCHLRNKPISLNGFTRVKPTVSGITRVPERVSGITLKRD